MDMSWEFVGFVGFVAILMFLPVVLFRRILHQQVNAIASIVTVIGVLGTFVGIAWALLNFDTRDIEASVPLLLDGLKFAFLTSILGIIGSIFLKCSSLYRRKKQAASEGPSTGATIDDLVNTLQEIYKAQQSEGNETRDTLRDIKKALTGDGDSTVLTQLQKLRTTLSDKQDDLIRAFNEYAEQMAENNSKALIEALEEVMRDFNAKINEQFGDNFKQLNEGVGRINEWQEQYRQQMDEWAREFQIAVEGIEKSEQSLESITERSDAIVSSAEKLDPILEAIQHQIQQIDDRLEAFNALAENARSAFPIIEERLDQLTGGLTQAVEENINNSQAAVDKQRDALADQSQQLETMVENTGRHIQEQTEALFRETTDRVGQVIESTFQGLKGTLEDHSQQLKSIVDDSQVSMKRQREALINQSEQLKEMVTDTNRRLNTETERIFRESTANMTRQIQLLDTTLEEELRKSIDSLGSQLASLSRKFVDDYTPLTERLHDVLQIANGVQETSRYPRGQ